MQEAVTHAPEWVLWLLVGSGATGFWFLVRHALLHYFGLHFATRKELDGVGGKVDGVVSLHGLLQDRFDEADGRISSLEKANELSLTPLIEKFDEFQKRQDQRDTEAATWREDLKETLGGLKGSLETFMKEHGRH